jgi:hypothetical protein
MTDTSRGRCCDDFRWAEESDLGTVAGHGLTLGRCTSCGMPVMTVVEPGDGAVSRVSLTQAEARTFKRLQDEPDRLKAALEAWVA